VARRGRAGAGRLAISEAFRPPIGRAVGRRTVRVGGVATLACEDEDEDGVAEKKVHAGVRPLGSGTGPGRGWR